MLKRKLGQPQSLNDLMANKIKPQEVLREEKTENYEGSSLFEGSSLLMQAYGLDLSNLVNSEPKNILKS